MNWCAVTSWTLWPASSRSSFFLRIHQSFLVNTLYVRRIQYDRLTLDDGTELPISQSYRRVVRGRLLRWTPGGMVL